MASRSTVSDAVRAQTSGDELVKLIGYVARMPDAELAVLKETDSSEFIAQFVRQQAAASAAGLGVGSASGAGESCYGTCTSDRIIRAQGRAASAAGPGGRSATGAGTTAATSAANHAAVPLLGTDDHGSWFWMLIRHFAAAADRYPSPHRRMQDGDLQASQTMRQHQD
ncbi:hypothetical protein CHLRE_16g674938v5 [Chlamydomonas reinhardtii]|uniref:Uncharacterized protein n=1 Tax=Chlamydomonas reinhardtii TaxID=3055 RepID=A0A2K3CVH0_CHLRE|nr:uncharacterized protein CHLRE_16g674938v5 [Chlamydomonas reinhardtii]PNW72276.1 hypothetical protein CHLRE_16g674938v5 [Chlamydomonas reinhardtii]